MSQSEGLVWPGTAALWQQTPLLHDASKAKERSFSFDWSRGGTPGRGGKRGDSATPVPFLSAFGEGLPFASRQRWKHFVALLLLSVCMFLLAGAFLPLVLLRPQKFCLFFTLGSMLSMASFAVLRGPLEQLKHMFSLQRCAGEAPRLRPARARRARAAAAAPQPRVRVWLPPGAPRVSAHAVPVWRAFCACALRLPFTSTYVGSMALTLYAALVLHSYLLVLLFSAAQAAAVTWYLLSYIPGGAPVLKMLTRGCLKAVSLCCRGARGSGGSALPWPPSLSRGGSSGLLPL